VRYAASPRAIKDLGVSALELFGSEPKAQTLSIDLLLYKAFRKNAPDYSHNPSLPAHLRMLLAHQDSARTVRDLPASCETQSRTTPEQIRLRLMAPGVCYWFGQHSLEP
jgi:hypothetical protein